MSGQRAGMWMLIALLCASCAEKKTEKELALEVELAKAKAAQAQAEAEKARLEAGNRPAVNPLDPAARIIAAEQAIAAKMDAEAAARDARQRAHEAKARVVELAKELDAMDQKVSQAVSAIVDAQSEENRRLARARLQELQQEQLELKQRTRAARDTVRRLEALGGVKLTKDCMDDPLHADCE